MTEPADIKRLVPFLWGFAGLLFLLAAWIGETLAFAGVGAMFMTLGVAAWIGTRKGGSR
jgi:hypothetical protein